MSAPKSIHHDGYGGCTFVEITVPNGKTQYVVSTFGIVWEIQSGGAETSSACIPNGIDFVGVVVQGNYAFGAAAFGLDTDFNLMEFVGGISVGQ